MTDERKLGFVESFWLFQVFFWIHDSDSVEYEADNRAGRLLADSTV